MAGALGQNQYGNNGSRAAGAVNPRFKYNVGDIIRSNKKPPGNWVLANGATVNSSTYPYLANVLPKASTALAYVGAGGGIGYTDLGSIAYGNGVYVAVGYNYGQNYQYVYTYNPASGAVAVVSVGAANTNTAYVTFYNGYFWVVTLGNNGVYYSSDGTNWARSGLAVYGGAAAFINNYFIGYGGGTLSVLANPTPTAGVGTSGVTNIGACAYGGTYIAYGNGIYMIVGENTSASTYNILTFANPASLAVTSYYTASVGQITGVIFVNGLFYICGTTGIASSPTGAIWTTVFSTSNFKSIPDGSGGTGVFNSLVCGIGSLAYANNTFYAAASARGTYSLNSSTYGIQFYFSSVDGINWIASNPFGSSQYYVQAPGYVGIYIDPISNIIILGGLANTSSGPSLYKGSLGGVILPNSGGAGYYVSASPNQFA